MIKVMKGNLRLAGEIDQRKDEKCQRCNKQDRNAVLVPHVQHGTRKRYDDQQGRDDGADGGIKYRPVEQRGPALETGNILLKVPISSSAMPWRTCDRSI